MRASLTSLAVGLVALAPALAGAQPIRAQSAGPPDQGWPRGVAGVLLTASLQGAAIGIAVHDHNDWWPWTIPIAGPIVVAVRQGLSCPPSPSSFCPITTMVVGIGVFVIVATEVGFAWMTVDGFVQHARWRAQERPRPPRAPVAAWSLTPGAASTPLGATLTLSTF